MTVARECTVCAHPDAVLINEAIVGVGEQGKLSNRAITRQYGLSKDAVRRHSEHIPQLLAKALEAFSASKADELLEQVRALQGKTLRTLMRAEGYDDLRTVLAAVREARGNVELLAKLRGELDTRPVINIHLSPQWLELRAIIVGALEPYADARESVLSALKAAEVGNGRTG
jgi:hypothetical protein